MSKILVVEDQPSVAAIVRYHLEHVGHHGVFAPDAGQAWRMLVSESPDAAVVDIRLPGEDGWSLIERMRDDGRFQKLPVVVLTAMVEEEIQQRANQLGCDYLSKPFAASVLLGKIDGLLREEITKIPEPQPAGIDRVLQTDLVAIGVTMLLNGYRIDGRVHLPPELARFSDAWESIMRDHRTFIPVTDARVLAAGVPEAIASPTFVNVRKNDLLAVFPSEPASE